MSANYDNGVITRPSPYSVTDLLERLIEALQSHNLQIFARIDQREAARGRGLDMPPMELLLFGNPAAGTPLMIAHPSLAIDLPLKALVWEDSEGAVWLSYNDPVYLKERHGLVETPFLAVAGLMEAVVGAKETEEEQFGKTV